MSTSLDEQIAKSGRAVFMLQTDKEALEFWTEPARAKIVVMYSQGCGWCVRFLPQFIRMAPKQVNSDLLFGSASREYLSKVMQFIPALQVNGFPTTILLDFEGQVRAVAPGYMRSHELIALIESKMPELRGIPRLQYLQAVKAESILEEEREKAEAMRRAAEQARAKQLAEEAALKNGGVPAPPPTFTTGAVLPSRTANHATGHDGVPYGRTPGHTNSAVPPGVGGAGAQLPRALLSTPPVPTTTSSGSAPPPPPPLQPPAAVGAAAAAVSGVSTAHVPGLTAGYGTAGDHALPPHLRAGGAAAWHPDPPGGPRAVAGGAATSTGLNAPPNTRVPGRKHKSRHHHHRPTTESKNGGAARPTNSIAPDTSQNRCIIL
jgi:hypothetical protein